MLRTRTGLPVANLNGIPGVPGHLVIPHLSEDGSDPFPDRAELYGDLHSAPQSIRNVDGSSATWYSGPRGFTVGEVITATDEQLARFERMVALIRYDQERCDSAFPRRLVD